MASPTDQATPCTQAAFPGHVVVALRLPPAPQLCSPCFIVSPFLQNLPPLPPRTIGRLVAGSTPRGATLPARNSKEKARRERLFNTACVSVRTVACRQRSMFTCCHLPNIWGFITLKEAYPLGLCCSSASCVFAFSFVISCLLLEELLPCREVYRDFKL